MLNSKLIVSAAMAVSAIVGIGAASAADMAPQMYAKAPVYAAPVYDWSGGYIGVQGGFGGGHSDQTDRGIQLASFDGHYSVDGGLLGGTLGYNWQNGRWVFGLEGDYSWSDISGHSDVCGVSFIAHPCGTRLDSLGTFRGRVGQAFGPNGNWLFYATGGLAVGDVHGWDAFTPASGSAVRTGWTVGAGLETSFAPHWTAKFEYLYVDLGKSQLFDVVPGLPETVSFTANIVRVGVNYSFAGPVVAKY